MCSIIIEGRNFAVMLTRIWCASLQKLSARSGISVVVYGAKLSIIERLKAMWIFANAVNGAFMCMLKCSLTLTQQKFLVKNC